MSNGTHSTSSGSISSGSGTARGAAGLASAIQNQSSEAVSKLSDAAQDAAEQAKKQAKESVRTLASQASDQLSGLVQDRIGVGADIVDEIAEAARTIASNLDDRAPRLAGMIRDVAHSAEEYADEARGKTISELVDMTSQFARRQPALFVGTAVAGGFLLARFLKTAPPSPHASEPGAGEGRVIGESESATSEGAVNTGEFHDA